LFLISANAAALVEIPAQTSRVVDLTQTLSAEQQQNLDAKLRGLQQSKGSQMAILLVPSTQPEDIAQFAIRVTDTWKLRRKGVDDGVLMVLAINDRKSFIAVGYGLEGAIPDAYAKRITTEVMRPYFKQGDFYGGLNAASDTMIGLINGEILPAPQKPQVAAFEQFLPMLLLGALFSGALLTTVFGRFLGGALNGVAVGTVFWWLGAAVLMAGMLGLFAFIFSIGRGTGGGGYYSGGGLSGGGFGGGSRDTFGDSGGGFSGGGASGDW
jgi:uncharacterized protein